MNTHRAITRLNTRFAFALILLPAIATLAQVRPPLAAASGLVDATTPACPLAAASERAETAPRITSLSGNRVQS